MNKIISSLLIIALLITVLTVNVFASADADSGIRILKASEASREVSFTVQMKLPENSEGITSFATTLVFDNTELNLMSSTGSTTYTADGLTETVSFADFTSPAVDVKLTDSANEEYLIMDASVFKSGSSSGIMVNGISNGDPNASQNKTAWQDIYTLRFEQLGGELTASSIRFALSTDNAIINGFESNNRPVGVAVELMLQSDGSSRYYNTLKGAPTITNTQLMGSEGNGETLLEPTYTLGDVNGLDGVNGTDLQRLYAHLNGTNPITDPNLLAAADVNGVDGVNGTDLQRLYAHLNGTNPLE